MAYDTSMCLGPLPPIGSIFSFSLYYSLLHNHLFIFQVPLTMKMITVDLAPGLPYTAAVDSFLQEIKESSSVLSLVLCLIIIYLHECIVQQIKMIIISHNTGTAAWRKKKSLLPFLEFPFREFIFYRLGLSTNTAIEPCREVSANICLFVH